MMRRILKENILWYNDKIKGNKTSIDIEVNFDVKKGDDLVTESGRVLSVCQSEFDRFTNMPRPSMGGNMIRVMPVSNEKFNVEW